MTKVETNKVLAIILEFYPSFGKNRNHELTSEIWHTVFQIVPFEKVEKALMNFIATDTTGYPPAPGKIMDIIIKDRKREEMTGEEAWERTKKAASRSLYYSSEEFEKLPPDIQAVVKSPKKLHHWASMDEWSLQHTVVPQFLQAYEDQMERKCRNQLLPGKLLGIGQD